MAQGIKELLDSREREVRRSIEDLRNKQLAPLERELAEIVAARKAIEAIDPSDLKALTPPSDDGFMRLTYEELAVLAFKDRFPDGATIGELLSHIREAYGRMISQGSFSPVLSRMKERGRLSKEKQVWKLNYGLADMLA